MLAESRQLDPYAEQSVVEVDSALPISRAVTPGRDWVAPPYLRDVSPGSWEVLVYTVRPEELPRPADLKHFAGSPEEGLWLAEEEYRVFLRSLDFAVSLDLQAKHCEAYIVSSYAWQNALRLIYFFDLLELRGLMLHASSIVHQGKAYVFPGPSGAGKTTIVEHSSGKPVLNDEISLLRWEDEETEVLAHGTPFYGDWNRPGEKLAAPVKGLYFPVQDQGNYVQPLSSQETLNRLLPRICTYTTWKPRLEKIFPLAVQLAFRVQGFAFHFQPSAEFWQVLDAS